MLRQTEGSISSFKASSYFDFLVDPASAFVLDMVYDLDIFLAFYSSCAMILLFLDMAPFSI